MSQNNLTKAQKEEIWAKYGKNKYIDNPKAEPIFQIKHVNYYPLH